jgi:hypothetical protein
MHKVVANVCYGGFSLSMKAIKWLSEHCEDNELKAFIKDHINDNHLYVESCISTWFDDKRHHKDLVNVVETLGSDANGGCADLCVVKISGNQYRIEEYDGAEEVVTPEDSDWIIIE